MEYWRNQLYHSELYHYGVKGMKWGKHIKAKYNNFYDTRITGNAYKESVAKKKYLHDRNKEWGSGSRYKHLMNLSRLTRNESTRADVHSQVAKAYGHKEKAKAYRSLARSKNIEARKYENRANQMLHHFKSRSLKGITQRKIKKAKAFISKFTRR